ncbi:3'-5' exonuclease [Modestobacter altitudinis]|uniref:3'-5' exonuclease n=1 Tax=Modestobacter altitudinis TaxID=2213158 RepID=UPI001486E1FF|nr:3'-5' exonuclease [Modestobacter altitudinis]
MTVVIAKQYEKDLRVDGSMKARAWDFMMKLNADPDSNGLDLKIPKNVIDRRVRTARVDQSNRAVLFVLDGGMLVMAAIKPHDEAYAYAQTTRLEVNPANGAMELIAEAAIQRAVETSRERPRPVEAPPILPFTVDELVRVGILRDIATEAIRVASEDDLLGLVAHIPEWQQQALLDLATGKSLDDVRGDYGVNDPATDDDPDKALERAVTRMEFVRIEGDDELRRMIEGDFDEWRTFLHPQQRAIVDRPVYNGPFRLAGGAGTGKTVVALHRAAHLARGGGRVLLCTFNRTLADSLSEQLRRLASIEELGHIDVQGVDQAVNAAVRAHDKAVPRFADSRTTERMWIDAVASADVPADLVRSLTPTFLDAELRTVLLGMPELTRNNYLVAKRPGRSVRLNRLQRTAVWRVVEEFRRALDTEQLTTYELLAARAATIASPSYDHVVVDEGQDLHAGHWRFLRALVAPGPNDMFICEDAHQRIYGEKLVLSRFGIETRGRSRRLTLNYRSSRQNLRFALGVIAGADIVDSEGDQETVAGYRAAFSGTVEPKQVGLATTAAENDHLAKVVSGWLTDGEDPRAVGVLVRRQADQERARAALQAVGSPVEVLAANARSTRDAVVVTTMHRAKGMEFSRVVVFGAAASVIPLRYVLDHTAPAEQPAAIDRERSLLYVACSRARDELVVTWAGDPSPFLPATKIA